MKELVVYIRGNFCPDVRRTREYLEKNHIPHRLIDASMDPAARERVVGWTGYLSFPTLIIADSGSNEPCEMPAPLRAGQSPRDVDRGTMLTEASLPVLERFLKRHGLIT